MKSLIACILALGFTAGARADAVFGYPHTGSGTLNASSWVWENGTDADFYAYESFILPQATDISRVTWRGGYAYGGTYGPIWRFNITIYDSTANDTQPYCGNPQLQEWYLANYVTPDNAGQTYAGSFGGVAMYDYQYTLSTPFHALANKKYWIRIEGLTTGSYPEWGIACGSGGNGSHFTFSTGSAMFRFYPNDTCFTLYDKTQTRAPQSYTVTEGEEMSGGLSSLLASDDVSLTMFNDSLTLGTTVEITSAPTTNLSSQDITTTVEVSAARNGLAVSGSLKNFTTGVFTQFFGAVSPTVDATYTFTATSPSYIDAGGHVLLRLHWNPINDEAPSQDGWVHSVDFVSFRIKG